MITSWREVEIAIVDDDDTDELPPPPPPPPRPCPGDSAASVAAAAEGRAESSSAQSRAQFAETHNPGDGELPATAVHDEGGAHSGDIAALPPGVPAVTGVGIAASVPETPLTLLDSGEANQQPHAQPA